MKKENFKILQRDIQIITPQESQSLVTWEFQTKIMGKGFNYIVMQ